MNNRYIQQLYKLLVSFIYILLVTGCTHTFQGMRQDINEDTSDNQHTVVVKRTTVVNYQSVPSSPPPLEIPPQ